MSISLSKFINKNMNEYTSKFKLIIKNRGKYYKVSTRTIIFFLKP